MKLVKFFQQVDVTQVMKWLLEQGENGEVVALVYFFLSDGCCFWIHFTCVT